MEKQEFLNDLAKIAEASDIWQIIDNKICLTTFIKLGNSLNNSCMEEGFGFIKLINNN